MTACRPTAVYTARDIYQMIAAAHALSRNDDWLICGANAVSMRFGFFGGTVRG